jgi:hypothetical protein
MDESSSLAALHRELDVIRAEYVAGGREAEFDAYVARMRASGHWPFDGRAARGVPLGRSSTRSRTGPRAPLSDTELVEFVRGLDGALVLSPTAGSDAPEIAWGDSFFYYAPDGELPQHVQPYATVVTKDYPGDTGSELDPPGRWRVNIHVDRDTFRDLLGDRAEESADEGFAQADVVLPHPMYGSLGWVAVVNPAERTTEIVLELLRRAHRAARARAERRAALGDEPD